MVAMLVALLLAFFHGQAHAKMYEKDYQMFFCNAIGGHIEYVLRDRTRVDCLTSNFAFEVDWSKKGYEAVGQSLHYSIMTGKKPGILLIQTSKKDNKYIGRIKRIAKKYDIVLFVINTDFEIRRVKY